MNIEDLIWYEVLAFTWFKFLWELYLSLRQHQVYTNSVSVPYELKEIMDQTAYTKMREYELDLNKFSMVKEFGDILITTFLMVTDGLLLFWLEAKDLLRYYGLQQDEMLCSAAFLFLVDTCNRVTSLPFSIYHKVFLEKKHGFNKQTARTFIESQLKAYMKQMIFMVIVGTTAVWIVNKGGDYFFIYLLLFTKLITFFLLAFYADDYIPLPDGELKTHIEELAASINFPLDKIYVVEGSKRSICSEAYCFGFFEIKGIIVFEPLLNSCNEEEVLAVLGHELGHWKMNHVTKMFVINMANMLLLFVVFSYLFKYKELYRSFGFYNEQPVIIGLIIVLVFILSPYNTMFSFVLHFLNRKFELQADSFAKSLGKAVYLQRALIKIYQDNLLFPVYDWLFSMWHHSHPTLLERLEALDKAE